MSRTVSAPGSADRQGRDTPSNQWDELYPSDPDLMASAEGDTRGLAELQRVARQRIDEMKSA